MATAQQYASVLEAVLAAMDEGVVLHDHALQVLSANGAAQQILGLSEDQLLGRDDYPPGWRVFDAYGQLLPPDQYPAAVVHRTGAVQRHVLLQVLRSDGSSTWIRTNARRLANPEGGPDFTLTTFTDVTPEHDARTRLAALQARFQGLLDNAPDAILTIDSDQNIVSANPAACDIFDYFEADLLGAPLALLLPEDQRARHATLLSGYRYDQLRGRRMGVGRAVCGRRRTGEAFPMEVALATVNLPEGIYYMAIGRDVTESHRAEHELRESQSRYERAVRGTEDGLWDWTPATGEAYLSPRFKALLGYADSEMADHQDSFFDNLHPEDEDRVKRAIESHFALDTVFAVQFRLRCKSGEYRWYFSRGHAVRNADGTVQYMSGFLSDITERKRIGEELDHHRHHLEDLVNERTSELLVAKAIAEEATAAKSAFLANISHEIRTPLNAVIGFMHLLRRDAHTDEERYRLGKVDQSARHLLGLINDLLDFSKLEAGKLELCLEPFAVAELMEFAVDIAEQRTNATKVSVRTEIAPSIPARLVGDRLRLGQILGNFATNAGKFTEAGSIVLRVQALSANSAGVSSLMIRFEVVDTGIGLTEAQQERLFQPFTQADSSITRRYGGTGLGLAVCRSLATVMEGRVGVSSISGQGSTFWLELPLHTVSGAHATHVSGPPSASVLLAPVPEEALAGRVLLAEDNPVNQELACEFLRSMGLHVDLAEDGAQALERCRAVRYDLVLMDMQMPVMDGITATRLLRREPGLALLPVLAMTANATANDRENCLHAGMQDFITKPIDPEGLRAILAKYLPVTREPVTSHTEATAALAQATTAAYVSHTSALPAEFGLLGTRWLRQPGVDHEQIVRTFAKRPELLESSLTLFLDRHADAPELLCGFVREARLADARHLAHTLKGTCANLGARGLSELAAQVENALSQAPPNRVIIPELVEQLGVAHRALFDALMVEPMPPAR